MSHGCHSANQALSQCLSHLLCLSLFIAVGVVRRSVFSVVGVVKRQVTTEQHISVSLNMSACSMLHCTGAVLQTSDLNGICNHDTHSCVRLKSRQIHMKCVLEAPICACLHVMHKLSYGYTICAAFSMRFVPVVTTRGLKAEYMEAG